MTVPMPFDECARRAYAIAKAGGIIYQKFNCEGCRAEVTMNVPNIFFQHGTCPDCEHVTDLRRKGCAFMAVLTADKPEDVGRLH